MAKLHWIRTGVWWAILAALTIEVSARVDDWVSNGAPLLGRYDIETIYEYDENGFITKEIDPDSNETLYTYDEHGNIPSP